MSATRRAGRTGCRPARAHVTRSAGPAPRSPEPCGLRVLRPMESQAERPFQNCTAPRKVISRNRSDGCRHPFSLCRLARFHRYIHMTAPPRSSAPTRIHRVPARAGRVIRVITHRTTPASLSSAAGRNLSATRAALMRHDVVIVAAEYVVNRRGVAGSDLYARQSIDAAPASTSSLPTRTRGRAVFQPPARRNLKLLATLDNGCASSRSSLQTKSRLFTVEQAQLQCGRNLHRLSEGSRRARTRQLRLGALLHAGRAGEAGSVRICGSFQGCERSASLRRHRFLPDQRPDVAHPPAPVRRT